ncbi:unnamed protein product [Acanthoscelides obtectus]|uniref:Uncharacterized protein n=1 Tax=Acanthoscelides obtectus TaxID=200917 RepID=A0A9P0PIH1_ACAOB|nr:unnamed protein product [Acanthoscelides obtectus]CAK1680827.1 hypothetical protein AOBTE_LOCUS32897 [Acanthoscelides obtectus]
MASKKGGINRSPNFTAGGGTKDDNSTPSIIDEKVLAVLGPSCVGLENPFDGDSSVSLSGEQWEEVEVVEVQQVPAFFVEEAKPPVNSEGPQPSTTSAGSSSSSGHKWEEYQPKHLMSPKAAPLKPKISAEQEWVKRSQRRRPQLPTNKKANQLIDAKLELARAAKEELELERVRKGELFEVEKRKKLLEEEMLKLQVLKLRKDLGLE